MDANGARFQLVPLEGGGLRLAFEGRRLRLLSTGRPAPPEDRAAAEAAAARPRGAVDALGTFAVLDATRTRVLASGAGPGTVEILAAPPGETFGELALVPDGILCAVLASGGLLLSAPFVPELEPPFLPFILSLPGFVCARLALGPDGQLWVLDRPGRRLARLQGRPLPRLLPARSTAEGFRPEPRNPDPPRLVETPLALPPDRAAQALTVDEAGRVVLLLWPDDSAGTRPAELMVVDGALSWRAPLDVLYYPFDIGRLRGGRLALVFAGWPAGRTPEAVAVRPPALPTAEALVPLGEVYPLPGWDGAGLLTGSPTPARYLDETGSPRPVVALSRPAYPRDGELGPVRLDGGTPGFAWHRLYLEAFLPPATGITIRLAARDDLTAPLAFAPHSFGAAPAGDGPRGVWLPQASELPFHPGLLGGTPEPDRCGLFSCLIQAPSGPDRTLRGRWLDVALTLHGDGGSTPELAALRIWGPRFSYRDQYLPRMYRDAVAAGGTEEDAAGRIDFLERFLALLEGVLTPMEDEVAAAWRLLAPATAPEGALDEVAAWLDIALDPALPVERQRRHLREATRLWRQRGTLPGLRRALDIATGDMAARGDLVIVEEFRLRRTMTTILGARLEPAEDPLIPGRQQGGNSVVGRTLFLGAESERELLALFRPEQLDQDEEEDALAFLDRLANRIAVLVHQEVPAETLGLIRRTLAAEVPAHVEARLLTASRPLLIGLSSLLAVDTYTRPRPPRAGIVLDRSRLGAAAFLEDARSLDPRLEGGRA